MTSFTNQLILLVFLLAHILTGSLLAQNNDQYNYRDQCRSIVAGKYWQIVDSLNTSELFVKMNQENLKKLKAEHKEISAKLKSLEESKMQKPFDPNRDDQIRIAEGKKSFIEKSIKTAENKIPELQRKAAQLTERRAALKTRMEKVFIIVEKPADTKGTVPKSISYKTTCPQFRHVCPLPDQERQDLKAIFVEETIPTPCLKYSYIR